MLKDSLILKNCTEDWKDEAKTMFDRIKFMPKSEEILTQIKQNKVVTFEELLKYIVNDLEIVLEYKESDVDYALGVPCMVEEEYGITYHIGKEKIYITEWADIMGRHHKYDDIIDEFENLDEFIQYVKKEFLPTVIDREYACLNILWETGLFFENMNK